MLLLLVLPAASRVDAQSTTPPSGTDLRRQLGRLSTFQQDEVIWLARCIYSESDRAHEQQLVAWVVRNRVETKFRGTTYREVVLEPRQFSAFNEPSIRRNHIMGLTPYSPSQSWRQALAIALDVYQAPASERPFAITTRHFYSPVSMDGGRTPDWAQHTTPLSAARLGIDPQRFKFYSGIDEGNEEEDGSMQLADRNDIPVQATSRTEGKIAATISGRLKPRTPIRSRLSRRSFSGRVKRPTRPHLTRPSSKSP